MSRIRVEVNLNIGCARMVELYVDGVRERVAEINTDIPSDSFNRFCHRNEQKLWLEFEGDIEITEKETDYGYLYRIATIKSIKEGK